MWSSVWGRGKGLGVLGVNNVMGGVGEGFSVLETESNAMDERISVPGNLLE